jgi:putative sterol carrier protein
MGKFPEKEWVQEFYEKLNSDDRYAKVAQKWEGDMLFIIDPAGAQKEAIVFYLDLWHGKCREAYTVTDISGKKAAFTLQGPYTEYVRLLKGDLEPMQALLSRKLSLRGNMAVLMRNIPVVLDFVRCAREVTDSWV